MLISFSLTNYRSVRDTIQLNMLPVKSCKELANNIAVFSDKNTGLLLSAVIYGANASGKSNVLKGLVDFVQFILDSSENKLQDKISIYDPFLLDIETETQSSGFRIEFLLDGIKYDYEVKVQSSAIQLEVMYYHPKGQRVLVFERYVNSPIKFGSVIKGEKKSIEARLLQNQLFLSKGANENLEFFKDIYHYFSGYDVELYAFGSIFEISPLSAVIARVISEKDENFRNRLLHVIKSFDIGIQSFGIRKSANTAIFPGIPITDLIHPEVIKGLNTEFNYEIITHHIQYSPENNKETVVTFTLDKESAGTRNLFLLATRVLDILDKGSVILIDEFERSLHPAIVKKVIHLFHDKEININGAQLLFTTHNTSLLDNELFRRDQIWFTEKDEKGCTELYSLSDIDGVRNTVPYDKWYMSGRFGATPIVQEPLLPYTYAVQKRK